MSYGDMIDRIEDELKRPDLSAQIALAIKDAIKFYESERFYFNEGRRTIDTAADKQYYALPSDFQEIDTLIYYPSTNIRYEIFPRTYEYIDKLQSNETVKGRPYYYGLFAQELRLYPIPDAAYRMVMSGMFKFDELSATADTNAFLTSGEMLIRHRTKAEVLSSVIRGPEALQEASTEKQKEQEELGRLRMESTSRRTTGKITPTRF